MSAKNVDQSKRGLIRWTTRDLMVMIAISLVLGLALAALNFVYLSLMSAGPIVRDTISGLWFIPSILAMIIIRRPGTAVLTRILVNLVQIPFTPFGWVELAVSVIFGFGAELPFLFTRYRNFRLPIILAAGAVSGLLSFALQYAFMGGSAMSWGVTIGWLIVSLVSGALLGGGGSKLMADGIVQTGVLANFEIAEEKAQLS